MQLPLSIEFLQRSGMQRQLVQHIKTLIEEGFLTLGSKVPSTRALSEQLKVSRGTVTAAYQQLIADGFLEARSASSTRVARHLPDRFIHSDAYQRRPGRSAARVPAAVLFPIQPFRLFDPASDTLRCDFRLGRADKASFPIKSWSRLTAACLGGAQLPLSQYGDPAGFYPLRTAISEHILRARGVRCGPSQIIIVAGCQEGLNLIARVLAEPGARVAIEDPCYLGAAASFQIAQARLVPVPVDSVGLITTKLAKSRARLVYVTPSHQFPLGSIMSLERRKELVDWAQEHDAYIIEDDYDGDFRYDHSPYSAVKAFDEAERVIYVGTFSKSIGAGLRLGYIIAPPQLVDALSLAKSLLNNGHPWLDQAVTAEFLGSGAFEKHLTTIRRRYLARRNCLIKSLTDSVACEVIGADGGMHLAVRFSNMRASILDVQARLRTRGIGIYSLQQAPVCQFKRFYDDDKIILLGYAAISEQQIAETVPSLIDEILS